VLVALAGARPAAAYDKSAFVAPEDGALVVLIQNLHEDRAMSFVVFDADKTCVAEVGGREAEIIRMKPGKHTLYVAAYSNHRIDLDLAAGRTYFIRLFSTEKFATRVSDVTLVQRGTVSYKLVRNWLEGARVVHASEDPCRGKTERSDESTRPTRIGKTATSSIGSSTSCSRRTA
jgi:hypothetical protein